MNKRHRCSYDNGENFDDNESAYITYCDVENEWALIASSGMYEKEVSIYIRITHCPFCGEKLKKAQK